MVVYNRPTDGFPGVWKGWRVSNGKATAVELLEAAKLYFKKHFELVPGAPEFVLNTTRGVHLLERALETAREERNATHEYESIAMLGIYHSNMSKLGEALAYYEEARAVIAANPDASWGRWPAMNYNNTAGVLRKMGRRTDEVEWLERSRAAFDAGGHAANVLVADIYLGEAYRAVGRLDDSAATYVRALALAVEIEQRGEIPWLKWGYGETLAKRGDKEAALAQLSRAEELFGEAKETAHLPPLYQTIYKLARGWGDEPLAKRYEMLVLAGTTEVPAAAAPGGS